MRIGFLLTGLSILLYQLIGIVEYDVSLISISLGLISFGIAFHSCILALDSDKKIEIIANSTFMEIYEELQDIFLEIQPMFYHTKKTMREKELLRNFIWKYKNCIMRARVLKMYANRNNQINVILPFKSLLEYFPYYKDILNNSNVEIMLRIYINAIEFDIDESDKKILDHLIQENIIGYDSNISIIDRVINKIEWLKHHSLDKFEF